MSHFFAVWRKCFFWGKAMMDVAVQTSHPRPACTEVWCALKYGSNNLHFRPLNSVWETQTEGGYSKKCCDVQKPAILTSLPNSCFKCLKWEIKNKKLFLIFTQLLSSHPLFEHAKVKPWMPLRKDFQNCAIYCVPPSLLFLSVTVWNNYTHFCPQMRSGDILYELVWFKQKRSKWIWRDSSGSIEVFY